MADNTYASRLLVKTGVTTSTFEDWVDLTNDIVSDMATTVVTVGTTTGNVAIVGAASANTVKVDTIEGLSTGSVVVTANAEFTGNVSIVGVTSANTVKSDTIEGLSTGSVVVTANAEFTGATVELPAVIVDSLDSSGASLPIGGDVDVQGDISANVATFDTVGALAIAVNGSPVFHDGYHPNADALTTARTISLTGDVTGSVSFDGSSNVSITSTVAALAGKAALAGSSTQAFSASALYATDFYLGSWRIIEAGGVLYFQTGGINRMKLDASGNLTVLGNITAYGSV
jgi:hypothetical protein